MLMIDNYEKNYKKDNKNAITEDYNKFKIDN